MKRINKILHHELFKEYLKKNKMAEADRPFCHHGMGHSLDVARLGMIFHLQSCQAADRASEDCEKMKVQEEMIYAAALLHDIGRWQQYEDGTPHEKASALLAPAILSDCDFTEEETEQILSAILSHRDESVREERNLNGILYRADKMSRSCFCCEMEKECDWKGSKKNLTLRY